jgi:16S rRNA (adenine1518-N6/adenine1519-N6)-dimethyltransferase
MAKFNKQKAFGQHFLVDSSIINGIVDEAMKALSKNPSQALLEIGPGEGAITRPLMAALPFGLKFFVAERDRELIEYWKPESRIDKLLEGDFLQQTDEVLKSIGPMVVVSNLPYSAGTAIVVRLAEMPEQISEMILMFQAEVAKRLYSGPSTPDRGSLSLYIQNEWEVERLFVVKPGAFNPPPKVMSEVVKLTRRKEAQIKVDSPEKREAFSELLKLAFKQRRKMMRGNLAGTLWQKAFDESGLDPKLRAEALEWKDWIALWQKRFS